MTEKQAPSADEQVRHICALMARGEWLPGSHGRLAEEWGLSVNSVYDRASEAGRHLRLAMGERVDDIVTEAVAQLIAITKAAIADKRYEAGVRAIELRLRALRAIDREGPSKSGPPAFPSARAALAYVENILPGLREQAAAEAVHQLAEGGEVERGGEDDGGE